ncbi:MAG: hypothetical protein IID32_09865 [Planctomycetes bacterium]|nr:hypothetical protein [Planctomycetota bacterium]
MAIVQSKTIKGEDAKKIVDLLGAMLKSSEATHFCGHSPVYGIVAKRADGNTVKTSLCFDCLTWVKPKKRLVIEGSRGINNPLCLVLRKHIELPPEVLRQAKKNKGQGQNAVNGAPQL